MCTVLLPAGANPIAVNKYVSYFFNFSYFIIVIFCNYLVILCTYVFCVLFVYSM